MLSRRRFLQSSSLVSLSPLVPSMLCRAARAAAPEPDSRVLVVIQLDGGNDGLNTVVPYVDDAYAKARPKLSIKGNEVHKLSDSLGLHPRMKAAKELFDDGRLAIIQGVGYPNPDRSHFRSMRIWQTGSLNDGDHNGYGWLGRALDRREADFPLGESAAFFVGDEQPPLALWSRRVASTSLSEPEDMKLSPRVVDRQPPRTANASDGSPHSVREFVASQVFSAYASADKFQLRDAALTKSAATYPDNALGARLRLVSQLLANGSRARVFYATQDGYDTHASQQYAHGDLLGELSSALKAFLDDLKFNGLAERVVVLAFSEFGRRVAENSSGGTDHGVAGPVFLAGAPAIGGLLGDAPDLTNLDGGDVRATLDFRRVYATLLDNWLRVPACEVLGAKFEALSLLHRS